MKTQISRNSRQPGKRYSGVYQQQGRMLTDADWNELMDILKVRIDDALADVVGSGAPKCLKSDGSVQRTPVVAKDQLLPGDLFVDGVRAELRSLPDQAGPFPYSQQADLPNPPALPANNYILYTDIWDRPVTALEDDAIRDAGLYGADTCTRTQTMVQVKWCPGAGDPGSLVKNPKCGNAAARAVVRSGSILADACDPCASEVRVKSGVGDYLFRVEVHNVVGSADAPTELTFKWSTENGAEAHGTAAPLNLPPDFSGTQWIYELFNHASECHLGVQLAAGAGFPARGALITAVPAAFNAGDCIRRWDGYATFARSGSTWTLTSGYEGNVKLSTETAADADGYVTFSAEGVSMNLRTVVLTMTLGGKQFVAGDYWLAEVRKNKHTDGSKVMDNVMPTGIVHHYLKLARVDAAGNLQPLSTTESQHLSFPRLSELDAKDVGYRSTAPNDFFNLADDTVQKALDKLTGVPAKYIPYTPSHPRPGAPNHVFEAGDNTVQKALDKVCGITAASVGFSKPAPADNSIYQTAAVATVDDALKLLADLKAAHVKYEQTGCSILAHAPTVQKALDDLCAYLESVVLDNTGRLLLFGRGVLCGLIPTLTVQSTNASNRVTAVKFDVSPGIFIDGKGGLRQVTAPLTVTAQVTAYKAKYTWSTEGIGKAIDALQVFSTEPRRLKTITLQPEIMAKPIAALNERLAKEKPETFTFTDSAEATKWVKQDALMANAELAEAVGEIIASNMTAKTVPLEVQVSLYINIVSGAPALQVQFNSPPPVVDNIPGRQIPVPGDIDGLVDSSGAVIPGPALNGAQAQQAVWAAYKAAACPQANDGSVCLGLAGVSGPKAFMCPDFREQIIYTPAQAAAKRAGELWTQKVAGKLTYQDLAAKCL